MVAHRHQRPRQRKPGVYVRCAFAYGVEIGWPAVCANLKRASLDLRMIATDLVPLRQHWIYGKAAAAMLGLVFSALDAISSRARAGGPASSTMAPSNRLI